MSVEDRMAELSSPSVLGYRPCCDAERRQTERDTAPERSPSARSPAAEARAERRLATGRLALVMAHRLLLGTSMRQLRPSMLAEVASNSLLRQLANHVPGPGGVMPAIRTQRSPAALRRDLKAYIAQTRGRRVCPAALPDRLHRNLRLCAKLMNLNAAEVAVIRFAIMLRVSTPLRELVRYWKEMPLRETSNIVAAVSHMHVDKIHRALGYGGRLRGMDLLNTAYGDSTVARMVRLEAPFADLLLHPRLDRDTLIRQFVPISPPATLGWDDFAHLERAKADVLRVLEGALKTKQRGVNVLFYGATGAGKTALARVMAAKLSVPLYFVRFADDEGESASSHERSNAYALAQTLVAPATGVVLFDEFDQVLNGHPGASADYPPSKHWFNVQLEDNALPSIFICNDINTLDAAHLRRFSYAIEFAPPSVGLKRRILQSSLCCPHALTPSDIDDVAQRHTVSLAHLTSAARTAQHIDAVPSASTLHRILGPLARLSPDSQRLSGLAPIPSYDLGLAHASCDLPTLTTQLVPWRRGVQPSLSLLLYGPPGTGKSAYLQYLAQQMGRPIIYRKAADVLGCLVGETERKIARAFAEAEELDAMLIFDEVDSFLQQRDASMRTWEVTGVNAFLQQLEQYQGIVGCTTNRIDQLDKAALRRFAFKIEMHHPKPAQRLALFETTLATCLDAPLTAEESTHLMAALRSARELSIGDFAVVARQHALLQIKTSWRALVAALVQESRHRQSDARQVGFVRQAGAQVPRVDPMRPDADS